MQQTSLPARHTKRFNSETKTRPVYINGIMKYRFLNAALSAAFFREINLNSLFGHLRYQHLMKSVEDCLVYGNKHMSVVLICGTSITSFRKGSPGMHLFVYFSTGSGTLQGAAKTAFLTTKCDCTWKKCNTDQDHPETG